ncbi:hypothetical protein [Algoriphagus aquaeductus]|uniref:hypothetical protein n=1 Tax=Algoriphagus aquaeductus TaxID=475299 RepID=UPI003919355E
MYVKVIVAKDTALEEKINDWLAILDADPIIHSTNLHTRKYGECTMVIFYSLPPLK